MHRVYSNVQPRASAVPSALGMSCVVVIFIQDGQVDHGRPRCVAGFSLLEVLLALAITSSLIVILMGALLAFLQTNDRLQQLAERRDAEIRQQITLEPLAMRIVARRDAVSWERRQILYTRAASLHAPEAIIALRLEEGSPGLVHLIRDDQTAGSLLIEARGASDAWFEYLTEVGWSEDFPGGEFYPAELMPDSAPAPPATPLAIRAVFEDDRGRRTYRVISASTIPPMRAAIR